jgi:Family of unknown function (DUF5677)
MTLTSWTKDVFPDFLWLCAHLSEDPLLGMSRIVKTLDAINEVTEEAAESPAVYGRLTQFEAVPVELREQMLTFLEERGDYEAAFPEEFAYVLGTYTGAPGAWLVEPWKHRRRTIDSGRAESYLSHIVTEGLHGQSLVATRAKFLYLRGVAKAGMIHFGVDSDIPELLSRYPQQVTEEERSHIEPTIRATFLTLLGADQLVEEREHWSKQFWRSNWRLYDCIKPESATVPLDDDPNLDTEQMTAAFKYFGSKCATLRDKFEQAATVADPDLYAPDRYEVLTGIVARCLRLVGGAAQVPLLWTGEHGSGLMRSVVEAKIVVRWLEHKEAGSIYTQFKDYGRGRLKLLKLHTEEYVDSLEDVPDELTSYLEQLDAEVNADISEEYQPISIEKTFSGTNIRQMSIDVGLKRQYDFVFAPASGTSHGDWSTLDRYALTRCLNPLHMWHRIPSVTDGILVDPSIMEFVLDEVDDLVNAYIESLKSEIA